MRCVVFELAGGGTYVPPPPPPGRAKVAQTPGRARVNVNGQKINSVMFTLAQVYLSEITSYRTVVDNSSKNLH